MYSCENGPFVWSKKGFFSVSPSTCERLVKMILVENLQAERHGLSASDAVHDDTLAAQPRTDIHPDKQSLPDANSFCKNEGLLSHLPSTSL